MPASRTRQVKPRRPHFVSLYAAARQIAAHTRALKSHLRLRSLRSPNVVSMMAR